MPLKIVRATEAMPVENIVLTIYAVPGVRKTSVAYTADDPLLLDFDMGSHRAFRRRGETVRITRWEDVEELRADDPAMLACKTVIIDTGGRAGDLLKEKLCSDDPKNRGPYGGMSGKGWGIATSTLKGLVTTIKAAGKDLVVVMHCDEKEDNGTIKERIDAAGAWKNEIYKISDAMARIRVNSKKGMDMDFDPSEGGFGKNPAQLPLVPVPNIETAGEHFLGNVIAQIKGSINRMTEAQAEAVKEAEQQTAAMAECDTLDKFNKAIVPLMKERGTQFKAAAAAEAKKRGYAADKSTGLYVERVAEAVAS